MQNQEATSSRIRLHSTYYLFGTTRNTIRLDALDWLTQHRFVAITRREYDWLFELDGQVSIVVGCLWRLLHDGHVCLTSLDDGHQFGLPAPIDSVNQLNPRLTNTVVSDVELRDGTLDLRITFDDRHVLEIIPDSSGYEAWSTHRGNIQFIAVGGGDLAIVDKAPTRRAEQSDEREPE
jgi:hypothetical protein